MKFPSIILTLLSVYAVTDATKVTFTNIRGRIYVETGPNNYAMYRQVTDEDGLRIVTVGEDIHHYLTSKCKHDWSNLRRVDKGQLEKYKQIREIFVGLKETNFETSPQSYNWTETFSSDHKEFSIIQLGESTKVYSILPR